MAKDELHPLQSQILTIIEGRPHFKTELVEKLDVPWSTISYHLEVMRRQQMIHVSPRQNRTWIQRPGQPIGIHRHPIRRKILRFLQRGDASVMEIAARHEIARRTIQYHMQKLVGEEEVEYSRSKRGKYALRKRR